MARFWKNFLIGLGISLIVFTLIACFGIRYTMNKVEDGMKDPEKAATDEEEETPVVYDDDYALPKVQGTFSFLIMITENTGNPDNIPVFDGETFDSLLETNHGEYAQTIRYLCAFQFNASTKQYVINTMSGNITVTVSGTEVPLDYAYYLYRQNDPRIPRSYFCGVGASYTGFDIRSCAIVDADGFSQLINALNGIEVDVPETIRYVDPMYMQNKVILPGKQILDAKQFAAMLRHDTEIPLKYCPILNSTLTAYFKRTFTTTKYYAQFRDIVNRWLTYADIDMTFEDFNESADILFSYRNYKSFSAETVATLHKLPGGNYYRINKSETVNKIKNLK